MTNPMTRDDIRRALIEYGDEKLEACIQLALKYRDEAADGARPDICDPGHSMGQAFAANYIAKAIRAMKEKM